MKQTVQIGKYEIVDLIGRGGMGVVYKACDTILGRFVALKVMTSGLTDNAEVHERFLREARSVSNLQHANIVVVHELGEHDGNPYIVMEYLDGEPLDHTIRNRTPLTILQKIDIILQVAKALQYAHEKGVIHRDVKPGNIMLLRDGNVKVVDFGIAHLADQTITRTGLVLGTVSYMSPEQLNGQPVDARTDIFSLGIVFYLLLTGKLPFEGGNTAETMMKILLEPVPPLNQYGEVHPPELQCIVDKALPKRREERYQKCSEVINEISEFRRALDLRAHLRQLEREREAVRANFEKQTPGPVPVAPTESSANALSVAQRMTVSYANKDRPEHEQWKQYIIPPSCVAAFREVRDDAPPKSAEEAVAAEYTSGESSLWATEQIGARFKRTGFIALVILLAASTVWIGVTLWPDKRPAPPVASGSSDSSVAIAKQLKVASTDASQHSALLPFIATPRHVKFGSQRVGGISVFVGQISVGNKTKSASELKITVGGDAKADFSTTGCQGEVPPEGDCTLKVWFKPTAAGHRLANLVIKDSKDSTPPTVVALEGWGIHPSR